MPVEKIKIKAFRNQIQFKDSVSISAAKTYQIDFKAWAEENNNVTAVTWEVKSGQATISNTALTSNVASALITFSQVGSNKIKITGTTSSQVYVVWLDVLVKDPNEDEISDYGL